MARRSRRRSVGGGRRRRHSRQSAFSKFARRAKSAGGNALQIGGAIVTAIPVLNAVAAGAQAAGSGDFVGGVNAAGQRLTDWPVVMTSVAGGLGLIIIGSLVKKVDRMF